MFTRNYKVFEISNKLGYNVYWRTTDPSQSEYVQYNLVASPKDINGSKDYVSVDDTNSSAANKLVRWDNSALPTALNSSDSYLLFGSGTTTPTLDDYQMEDAFGTDTLQYVSQSTSSTINDETHTFQMIFTNTLRNITSSDITIKEVGYIKGIYTLVNGEGDNVSPVRFLFWREVLETPITIAAGTTKTITTVITF